jgi:hypothetical protein
MNGNGNRKGKAGVRVDVANKPGGQRARKRKRTVTCPLQRVSRPAARAVK